jgi:MFS family permease
MFLLAGLANAMVLLTWAPIFSQATTYFSEALGSSADTGVNMFFSTFQIMFLPGTLAGIYIQKKYGLRNTLLYGGLFSTVGCVIRYIAATSYTDTTGNSGSIGTYIAILMGTLLVAQAQPVYLNLPTMLSLTWFPVSERDFAMTILSLANTAGSAVGSVIPTLLVKEKDTSLISLIPDVNNLLFFQMVVSCISFITIYFLFLNAPAIPPSIAAEKLLEGNINALITDDDNPVISEKDNSSNSNSGNGNGNGNGIDNSNGGGQNQDQGIWISLQQLFSNSQYILIFIGFASAIASLNSLASLLGQLPTNNTSTTIGFMGFSLILAGFIGAVICGTILSKYQAYGTILKVAYTGAMIAWISFMLNIGNNNSTWMCITAGFTGFFVLACVPAGLQNAVESAYPVSEDITVGSLYLAANILTIPYTYIGQSLLNSNSNSNSDGDSDSDDNIGNFSSFAWFSTCMLGIGWVAVMFYRSGEYKRLNLDQSLEQGIVESEGGTSSRQFRNSTDSQGVSVI